MRILIGCDTFAPDINGAASFAKRLGAGLAARGHDVHVIAPAQAHRVGTFAEVFDGQTLTVHRVYSWRWLPHPWLRFMLPWRMKANSRKVIDAMHPDVVHFQSHIVVGSGLAPVAKSRGIRIVGTNHTMPENVLQHVTIFPQPMLDWLARVQWKAAARIFRMADVITSPTQSSASYFEKMTGLTQVVAISNGIDTTAYTPEFTRQPDNRVVYVGRLDEEKHVDELIRAAARMDPALDVQVDIVGGGEVKQKLRDLAASLGVSDRVHILGKVSDEELRATLTRGTVFAMPSRAELQCIAAMEAMATALPVVAANAMALPHLVHEGENGHLYEPGDIDGLAAALTDVLTAGPEKLDRMKRASLEVVAHHSMAHTLDVFEALYRGEPVAGIVADPVSGPETITAPE
ncbi:glycosyltransferase [Lysinimonas soli]|uniref:D-inositol 3-phosphate glycosyltransferase n=1 Tax=Lysinimonas soli TaxID=1074233 RepID=A0ABW0NN83_9MICO